ncbi:hypothetical protein B0G57_101472 [Trinickia symbiotica]|uniref:Uncharacterized protein n=1 Tax=Trinickia symbiotica TaxID=863227 RepID=A0A2N7X8J0_9BURK|nr:hypothetical protein [Trinickia symbiotica]PMS37872.1 hypothetical protein C0Z20_03345 [Trinickia symbiotica]PPK47507.1 hypothetical protein B0G57_101472 [Trinickia symbiotica]
MDHLRVFSPPLSGTSADAGVLAGAAFADALTSIDEAPALRMLVRRLDEIERGRRRAAELPGQIAHAHAHGASGPEVVLAMHRQARLMAAYQIDVMCAARVVGATAAGLKQLVTAA